MSLCRPKYRSLTPISGALLQILLNRTVGTRSHLNQPRLMLFRLSAADLECALAKCSPCLSSKPS